MVNVAHSTLVLIRFWTSGPAVVYAAIIDWPLAYCSHALRKPESRALLCLRSRWPEVMVNWLGYTVETVLENWLPLLSCSAVVVPLYAADMP